MKKSQKEKERTVSLMDVILLRRCLNLSDKNHFHYSSDDNCSIKNSILSLLPIFALSDNLSMLSKEKDLNHFIKFATHGVSVLLKKNLKKWKR